MNERKLRELLESVRRQPAPEAASGFDQKVLRAIRNERQAERESLFDQLGALFPRLALASLVMIGVSVATDFGLSSLGQPDLATGASELSDQWLFTTKGF